jgi:hypothetical protein
MHKLRTTPALEGEERRSVRPAARVAVRHAEGRTTIVPIPEGTAELAEFQKAFCAAFGTMDGVIAEALFDQLLNGLHTDPSQPIDDATANLALVLMHEIGPRDVLEGLIGVQMVVTHIAAMDVSRRALHVEQTPAGRTAYLGLARRLMALFAEQMDALNRHRGKGTTQKIVIERVFVAPGGQAVVGAVATGREGDGR